MVKTIGTVLLLTGLSTQFAWSAPGDYDPAYEQGYGAGTLDERVAKLEKKLSGEGLLEMLNRMEQLQSDVLRLRGEVEELTHQLETVKRQQKDMYMDLDRRLPATATPPVPAETPAAPVEPASIPPAPVEPPPVPAAPAVPSPSAPLSDAPRPAAPMKPTFPPQAANVSPAVSSPPPSPSPQKPAPKTAAPDDSAARQAAYQKAFNVLKDGKYGEAVKEFKGFLAAYPKGEYSDNAAYWLAEAQYVNRDMPAARESFRKVVREFPQAGKAADSLLKLGYIDYDTGQWTSAREILNDVIKRHPDSSAAKLARKRLDKMKLEGH
ncbi:MAG: tol-pal system protein YbgF [Methylococcaceae bacterium]|nr:tol-pal system protein YbgF [Methylococcaceae bacterium]